MNKDSQNSRWIARCSYIFATAAKRRDIYEYLPLFIDTKENFITKIYFIFKSVASEHQLIPSSFFLKKDWKRALEIQDKAERWIVEIKLSLVFYVAITTLRTAA